MGTLDSNNNTYINEILEKKLILSKSLTKSEEDNFLPKLWFCSLDVGEWEEVEIFVQGDDEKPSKACIELAEEIFKEISQHISRALKYLMEFFPNQKSEDYYLSTISFGKMINFDDHLFTGFTMAFYSEQPYEFQYKVKFKANGWPIGFEGGPM
ncbi:MAG: hypothetical protein ABS934_08385 [Psychrobacillus sp.]